MKDRYRLIATPSGRVDLALVECFLWIQHRVPQEEIDEHLHALRLGLHLGGWRERRSGLFTRGALQFAHRCFRRHARDDLAGRSAPEAYGYLEVSVGSRSRLSNGEEAQVWAVLDSGMRDKGVRGNPHVLTTPDDLQPFLPAQVELGSGPSTEIGVPPLRHLHHVYDLSDPVTGHFRFCAEGDQCLQRVTVAPERFYPFAADICTKTVTADLGTFYPLLPELRRRSWIVGPLITHNFDGIPKLYGFELDMIRRYDEVYRDAYRFAPEATSLLVVGLHADRRRVQAAARAAGLPVIHLNPEGFDFGRGFVPCPVEGPLDQDMLLRMSARDFADGVRTTLHT